MEEEKERKTKRNRNERMKDCALETLKRSF